MATNSLQVDTSYRQIIKLALPISFAMLIPQFNFITTNIFLGHYNQQSLAIAGITGVYYLIFAMIGFGLNNGLQALIARRAGDWENFFARGLYRYQYCRDWSFAHLVSGTRHFKASYSRTRRGRKIKPVLKDQNLGFVLLIHLSNAQRFAGRNKSKQIPGVWHSCRSNGQHRF